MVISKISSTRVCKKNFLLRQKKLNYFCIGCPNSALRVGKTLLLDFFSYGHPQQKNRKSQEFSCMGCLSFDGGGFFYPPFKNNFHIQN